MKSSERIVFSRRRWLWLDPFLRHYVRRRVHAVHVEGELEWSPEAVNVIMPQHVGRLDGFIIRMIQRKAAPSARLVTIMLDEQLNRHPVFRKAGAVGISPGSLKSARMLKKMIDSEFVAGDCISIFPQGRIETVDADPSLIKGGYRHFDHPRIPTRFIPVAISVEPLTHSKPSVFVRIGQAVEMDQAANAFAETVTGLRSWLQAHGETAGEAWPGERLL
jgi:1-acyl-sn-glycerol-3-phosphate acyltransferase